MLWIIFAAMVLLAVGFLVWPLLRAASSGGNAAVDRGTHDMTVYRDQLNELEEDLASGRIGERDAAAAKLEISRRLLRVDTELQAAAATGVEKASEKMSLAMAAILVVGVPVSVMVVYLFLGSPDYLKQAEVATNRAAAAMTNGQPSADDIRAMVEKLAKRLETEPDDMEGWRMLGRSYRAMGDHPASARAFGRAAALDPENSGAFATWGEALVFSANGTVTGEARAAFEKAYALNKINPVAQYYMAIAKYQAGDGQGAFAGLVALARAFRPDAPWQGAVRGRLAEVAAQIGAEVPPDVAPSVMTAAPLGSTGGSPANDATSASRPRTGPDRADIEAAAELSDDQRNEFIRSMVARLAGRLEENPDDADGWLRLGRAYGVLGERDKSLDAYQKALKLRPDDQKIRGLIESLSD